MSKRAFEPVPEEVEAIGKTIIDAAFKVHDTLGPGLLESVYERCLAYEIRHQKLKVEQQVYLPVIYGNERIETGLRLDLFVEEMVIVELKAVENIIPLYEAQLLTYLKLTNIRLGFLINFNVLRLKNGIKRMVV